MSKAIELYGTDVPNRTGDLSEVGDLSFTLEDCGLRHIKLGGVEIIRAVSFLVRDRDWGTLAPIINILERSEEPDRINVRLQAVYESAGADLKVELAIDASMRGLTFVARGTARGDFETNRAGFTVLHPASLAGCPVRIEDKSGGSVATEFPVLIEPWQPFMNIAAMIHRASGLEVTCAFEGDTFETEDQRQWGDASFKTYNRPLAKPWPYFLEDGSKLEQSVKLRWRAANTSPATVLPVAPMDQIVFPQTAILVDAKSAARLAQAPTDLKDVAPQRLLCGFDETKGKIADQIEAFGNLQQRLPEMIYDLEAVCAFVDSPEVTLARLRDTLDEAGFKPASVLICPAADRQSTPPGSEWPECPPLEEVHAASAAIFPELERGGGMVSFFPELNRKRPPLEKLDFVSHSLCPIVHAADDLSVMESLEAIPHITASARHIIGKREYRIGPSTIAMRHNPYGGRTLPNPERSRICMADDDPRHFAAFGAAYTVGLACALASAGISVWTPAELYGPRGLGGPLIDAVAALARLAGQRVLSASLNDGIGELSTGGTDIKVNLTPEPRDGLPPFGWTLSGNT